MIRLQKDSGHDICLWMPTILPIFLISQYWFVGYGNPTIFVTDFVFCLLFYEQISLSTKNCFYLYVTFKYFFQNPTHKKGAVLP